jgi:hypothetical protein
VSVNAESKYIAVTSLTSIPIRASFLTEKGIFFITIAVGIMSFGSGYAAFDWEYRVVGVPGGEGVADAEIMSSSPSTFRSIAD